MPQVMHSSAFGRVFLTSARSASTWGRLSSSIAATYASGVVAVVFTPSRVSRLEVAGGHAEAAHQFVKIGSIAPGGTRRGAHVSIRSAERLGDVRAIERVASLFQRRQPARWIDQGGER